MIRHALPLAVVLLATGCDKPSSNATRSRAAGQSASPAKVDVAKDPTVLLRDFDTADITLHGISIGQSAERIPPEMFAPTSPEHLVDPRYFDLTTGNRVWVENRIVVSFTIFDEAILSKLGLRQRDDIELVFGKADRLEKRPPISPILGEGPFYEYVYLKKRMKVSASDRRVVRIDLR